jgi:hypothetical protein
MVVHDPGLSESGFLPLGETGPNGLGETDALLKNVGKGVAFDEHAFPTVRIVEFPTLPSLVQRDRAIDAAFNRYVRRTAKEAEAPQKDGWRIPVRDIAPGIEVHLRAGLTARLSQKQSIEILARTSVLVFMGLVRYKSLGESHETEFCWFYQDAGIDPKTKTFKYNFVLCQDHNTIR